MAERTDRSHHLGVAPARFLQENVDKGKADFRQSPFLASPAATSLQRVVDDFCAHRPQQLVHGNGVVHLIEGRVRAHDLAAVIGSDFEARQRLLDARFNLLNSDVIDQDVEGMPHLDGAGVSQPRRLETVFQRLGNLRVFFDVVLCLVENQITSTARRHQVQLLLLRQGQVASCQGEGVHFINRHVRRRAAAVPVLQFLEFNIQCLEDRQERFFVGFPRSSQRAARVIEVSLHAATSLCASTASSSV